MARRVDQSPDRPNVPLQGRGAVGNPAGRFETWTTDAFDDGWTHDEVDPERVRTVVTPERAKSIISHNQSPDIPFDRSLNPYRGCEHGCVYCYARPSHGYLGLSAGLDFETRIFAKVNAASLLRTELGKRGYAPQTIVLGVNTDAYQPAERTHGITRAVLTELLAARHPTGIVTKSALIQRDLDLWRELARHRLASVQVSVTTLDRDLARKLEPRAPTPERRLETIAALAAAGVPVGVMAAPMIPGLNDHELEAILKAAHAAGARQAGYVLLRLPHELKGLFGDWLTHHAPGRKEHVMQLVRGTRDGQENDAQFGSRMRGTGVYADLLQTRFRTAVRRLGMDGPKEVLDFSQFVAPKPPKPQLDLF